jgi:hypothetical protein
MNPVAFADIMGRFVRTEIQEWSDQRPNNRDECVAFWLEWVDGMNGWQINGERWWVNLCASENFGGMFSGVGILNFRAWDDMVLRVGVVTGEGLEFVYLDRVFIELRAIAAGGLTGTYTGTPGQATYPEDMTILSDAFNDDGVVEHPRFEVVDLLGRTGNGIAIRMPNAAPTWTIEARVGVALVDHLFGDSSSCNSSSSISTSCSSGV